MLRGGGGGVGGSFSEYRPKPINAAGFKQRAGAPVDHFSGYFCPRENTFCSSGL